MIEYNFWAILSATTTNNNDDDKMMITMRMTVIAAIAGKIIRIHQT